MEGEWSTGIEGEHDRVIIVKTRVLNWRRSEAAQGMTDHTDVEGRGLENREGYFNTLQF